MITENDIHSLAGNHSAPYMYSGDNFKPGETPIRYSGPYWDNREIEAAINAFLNGKWIAAGENVFNFEKTFSEKFNTKHSLMVNSGSSANLVLIASLKKYFGWVDFSEIIVSPVGFPTTISVLYQNRLKPIFVDTEWDTLNFDLNKIEDKITTRTVGIFLSPVLGNPPDVDNLLYICDKYDLVLIGDNCLLPDQNIITNNGIKNVEDVLGTDMLYSHKGKFREIQSIFKRQFNGDAIYIKTYGHGDKLKVTTNHPVLCVKTNNIRSSRNLEWIDSQKIEIGDYLVFPRYKDTNDITYYDFSKYDNKTPRSSISEKFNINRIEKLEICNELMVIIGWYLAEGFTYRNQTSFSLSKKELDNQNLLISAIKYFNFHFSVVEKETTTVITIFNKQFKFFMKENFGNGSKNLNIPKWIIDLSVEKIEILLDNYILGDGCAVKGKNNLYISTSISLHLLMGLKIICSKLGYTSGIGQVVKNGKGVIMGRTVNVNDKYQFRFSKLKNCEKNHMDKKMYVDDDYIYNRVTCVENKKYNGFVYNFKVKTDNSYTLSNWCIHNCDSLGSKWKGRYLNEYCVAYSNSFYAAHHITCGQGGMVCTDNNEIMKIMRSIATWGRSCTCCGEANMSGKGSCGHRFDKWLELYDGIVDHKYIFSNIGYNLSPLDMQGAIGLVQLDKFDEIERKRKISKKVLTKIVLDNIPDVKSVETLTQSDVCWFGTPFICEEPGLKHRLVAHLEKNLIQTRNYFAGNILLHPGFKFMDDYRDYPEANKILDKVFFIGASPSYNQNIFDYCKEVIKKFTKE